MLERLADYLTLLRYRWELRSDPGPAEVSATQAEIAALVQTQIAYWAERQLDSVDFVARARSLGSASVAIFEAGNGKITVRKADRSAQRRRLLPANRARILRRRRAMYLSFLQLVLRRYDITEPFVLAIDLRDRGRARSDLPMFCFQKLAGSPNILLPDVDFFQWHWYAGVHDPFAYDAKKISACFAGASTGGLVTEKEIAEPSLPRLRAAAHFVGHPRVIFRIAKAVQYDNPQTKALLEKQSYFGPRMSWHEQLAHRFLLSIDGNGATCSRVAIALKSNSVLVKYSSPYCLYYFDAMKPDRDCLTAESDTDVDKIIEAELRQPGHYKAVAEAGSAFFNRYLNKRSVFDYTAALLRSYAAIYNQHNAPAQGAVPAACLSRAPSRRGRNTQPKTTDRGSQAATASGLA